MRVSGTAGTALVFVLLAGMGAGIYFYKGTMEARRAEQQIRLKQTLLKTKEAERLAKEAESRTAADQRRKAEADKARAASEQTKSEADLAAKKEATEQAKAAAAAAAAETEKSMAAKLAAEAEAKKNETAKAAHDAALAVETKKAQTEATALQRASEERKRADAQLADTLAKKRIAEAALKKSENELKAVELNAQAERDRKLRMYRRAETSRAEMLALQRAERLLALDEAGALTAADLASDGAPAAQPADGGAARTNAVVKVDWPEAVAEPSPAGTKVAANQKKMDDRAQKERTRRMREYVASFGALAAKADGEKRTADARHYRQTLVALVPGYLEVYIGLIDEARKRGDAREEGRLCSALLTLVPDWQRVAVGVQLLERDEAYFSKMLAGRLGRDEFVKSFRKIYDKIMRDKGDHDERRAKTDRLCAVLATYVPDFEKSPEWK